MKKQTWLDRGLHLLLSNEARVSKVVTALAQAKLRPGVHLILKAVRYHWRGQPAHHKQEPVYKGQPKGPFTVAPDSPVADMLIFAPRALDSYLIDDITGGYGYSHVGVDVGEVDQDTHQRLMVESMPLQKVHRSFQDIYGPRPFIRIPLNHAGVNPKEFRECILSKMGEPYDEVELFTWGAVDDPAKQICSDLAMVCLPEEMQADIARQREAGKLPLKMASVHRSSRHGLHTFVSPNGFAKYFGAPHGTNVPAPDTRVEPHPGSDGPAPIKKTMQAGTLLGLGLAVLAIIWVGRRRLNLT